MDIDSIPIKRRRTRKIYVGDVAVGGGSPISVQSMTNTPTSDIKATISQILSMEEVGVDIVRCSCMDKESALAIKEIKKEIHVPLVADIHFNYKRAIEAADSGASCLRINPGNIGGRERVKEVLKAAKANNCSIRIGINGGSLEKDILEKYKEPSSAAMVESALRQVKMLEDEDFFNFKLSVKSSDVKTMISAYRELSSKCDYPLHIGVTEAGSLRSGLIKSGLGIGSLLLEGIGDTLRVSLTADVREEIKAGYEILKALGLRQRGIRIISCPTCSRKGYEVEEVVSALEDQLGDISDNLSIAVMGCLVNGPGEASTTDIGIAGGGEGINIVYIGGFPAFKVKSKDAIRVIVDLVREAISLKRESNDWLNILREHYNNKETM